MPVAVRSTRVPRLLSSVLALLLVGIVLASCSGAETRSSDTPAAASATPKPIERVTFMAGFTPQANLPFVAAYVAQQRGFFAEERLEVDIRHSSGQDEHLKLLLNKDVDFVTASAAQALRRSEGGLPVVAVALFGQRGDQGYVARADSGIKSPADFKGRTIGFKSGIVPAELEGMLKGVGLTRADVRLVAVGFDPREFIEKKVDVYPVFLSNEPDTIRKAGVEITVFDPSDFGVPTLGLTYLANSEVLRQRPDVAERFLRATLRATKWIEANPDAAIEITLQYAKGANAAHQRFLLGIDLKNAARADGFGRSDDRQWQSLADLLASYKVLPKPMEAKQAFDMSIVNRLYEQQQIK